MTTQSTGPATTAPTDVDARVPRFIASATATVLVAVLLVARTSPPAAAVLLAAQAAVFGAGALWGPLRHPYGRIQQALIAPRLGPAAKRDPLEQLRFAQLLGCVISAVGAVGFAAGAPAVGYAATGFALFAALMRALFGICVSRGLYMVSCRMRGKVPACCQNK